MTIAAASRDISAADLQVAMAAQRNPDLLRHLVELSRSAFDFYPSHFPKHGTKWQPFLDTKPSSSTA
jgi:hypothetical protein